MKPYSSRLNLISFDSYELPSKVEPARLPWYSLPKLPNLGEIWQTWFSALSGNPEPRIYRKRDRYGNSYFQVYDPTTGLSSSFGTEKEVRIWLDERYYQ